MRGEGGKYLFIGDDELHGGYAKLRREREGKGRRMSGGKGVGEWGWI